MISTMASYSFGIYLVHPAFLDLAEIRFWDAGLLSIHSMLITTLFALVLTSLAVVAMSRLPVTAWTVGLGRLRGPLPQLTKSRLPNFTAKL